MEFEKLVIDEFGEDDGSDDNYAQYPEEDVVAKPNDEGEETPSGSEDEDDDVSPSDDWNTDDDEDDDY